MKFGLKIFFCGLLLLIIYLIGMIMFGANLIFAVLASVIFATGEIILIGIRKEI